MQRLCAMPPLLRLHDLGASAVAVDAAVDWIFVVGFGEWAHGVGWSTAGAASLASAFAGDVRRISGAYRAGRAVADVSCGGLFHLGTTEGAIHHEAGSGIGDVVRTVIASRRHAGGAQMRVIDPGLRLRGILPEAVI